jgi:hypothetical protein
MKEERNDDLPIAECGWKTYVLNRRENTSAGREPVFWGQQMFNKFLNRKSLCLSGKIFFFVKKGVFVVSKAVFTNVWIYDNQF